MVRRTPIAIKGPGEVGQSSKHKVSICVIFLRAYESICSVNLILVKANPYRGAYFDG